MVWCHARTLNNKKETRMKIRINGLKVRAFKGVDKKGRGYEFITLWGRDDKDNPVRVIFNNAKLYGTITSVPGLTALDCVEVVASTTREHKFTGRDGSVVSVIETTDPMPTGIGKSAFPATEKWPEWGDLMKAASASESADAPAAEDSEAEF